MGEQFKKHCTLDNKEFKDFVFGLLTLAFFVVMLLLIPSEGGEASGQSLYSAVGPKTYPYIISIGGIFVSLILLAKNLIKILKDCKKELEDGTEVALSEDKFRSIRWKVVGLSSLALIIGVILIIKLGIYVGGPIYIFGQIMILTNKEDRTKKNIIIALIVSILVPLAIYFPFRYLLHAKLPLGILKGFKIF